MYKNACSVALCQHNWSRSDSSETFILLLHATATTIHIYTATTVAVAVAQDSLIYYAEKDRVQIVRNQWWKMQVFCPPASAEWFMKHSALHTDSQPSFCTEV